MPAFFVANGHLGPFGDAWPFEPFVRIWGRAYLGTCLFLHTSLSKEGFGEVERK